MDGQEPTTRARHSLGPKLAWTLALSVGLHVAVGALVVYLPPPPDLKRAKIQTTRGITQDLPRATVHFVFNEPPEAPQPPEHTAPPDLEHDLAPAPVEPEPIRIALNPTLPPPLLPSHPATLDLPLPPERPHPQGVGPSSPPRPPSPPPPEPSPIKPAMVPGVSPVPPAPPETPTSPEPTPVPPPAEAPPPPDGVANGATLVSLPVPRYPYVSRRDGQQGTVIIEVHVLADGSVGDVTFISGPDYPQLIEAALAAARKARFTPATRDGVPVPDTLRIPFEFVLH
ncbi:MAG: TonB family protein [Phycisphaera sp.]|nr:TonB family protein [Phycisphaera sp.]